MRNPDPVRRLLVLGLGTLGLWAGGLAVSSAAAAQPTPPPEGRGFAIAVDDKTAAVRTGDTVTYEVTLRNTTQVAATADVELTLPVGAAATTVGNGGRAPEPWYAKWTLDVPAGGSVTVSAAFVAGPPVDHANGYAASACLVEEFARLICATDTDQLLGADDIRVDLPGDGNHTALLRVAVAILVLLAVVALGWLWHRRWVAGDPDEPEPDGGNPPPVPAGRRGRQ